MNNKGDYLHLLNIALMAITLIVAIKIPFELFLFGYAILGPLHYVTEINWLNKNQFYIRKLNQIWILVGFTALISLPIIGAGILPYLDDQSPVRQVFQYITRVYGSVILMSFVLSIGLVYFRKSYQVVLLVFAGGLMVYFFRHAEPYQLLTGLLLPSLIHVYVFTLMFMAYGITKTRSRIGTVEVLLLFIVPVIIFFLPVDPQRYLVHSTTITTFMEGNFGRINAGVGTILGVGDAKIDRVFVLSETGIRIQIFVAFAYMYHYLNWFSKVSLIGWLRNTSREKIASIFLFWIGAVGLYLYDYRTGLAALFFLSLLHVILEFPLNVISIRGLLSFIGSKLPNGK